SPSVNSGPLKLCGSSWFWCPPLQADSELFARAAAVHADASIEIAKSRKAGDRIKGPALLCRRRGEGAQRTCGIEPHGGHGESSPDAGARAPTTEGGFFKTDA